MLRLRLLALAISVVALAAVVAASAARPALAVGSQIRTFVATTGSDANPCSRTAPCRTFGAALAQTASGGEIVALDSGGYGTVNVSQAVTIAAAPGVQASISPSSGIAIGVNAGASDTVTLRNLTLNGQGGSYGVYVWAAGSLHIENLTIDGVTVDGIRMSLSSAADIYIADTIVRRSGQHGIYLSSSAASARAFVVRTRIEESAVAGLYVASNVRATVKDSVAWGNGNVGFYAYSSTGELNLEDCVSSGNGTGVAGSGAGATGRVSNCVITNNGTGVNALGGGAVLSRGNNTVEGNTSNGSFTGTYAAK